MGQSREELRKIYWDTSRLIFTLFLINQMVCRSALIRYRYIDETPRRLGRLGTLKTAGLGTGTDKLSLELHF